MTPAVAPTMWAAMAMDSMSRCGLRWSSGRSLKVPGSPSSALQTTYFRSPGVSRTACHLAARGKPAPPRPRRPLERRVSRAAAAASCSTRRCSCSVAAVGAVDVKVAEAGRADVAEEDLLHAVDVGRRRRREQERVGGGPSEHTARERRGGLVAEAGAGDALAGRASAYADAGQAAGGAAAGALSQDVVLAQVGVVVEGGGLVDIGSRNLQ